MGAEESRESVPRNNNTMPNLVQFFDSIMGAEESRGCVPRNHNTTRNRQSSCRPSVTEFSENPEGYPGFILVLVLSTGKMEVMTRQETRAKAAQIKIISDNSDSVNSSFFRFSSNSDEDDDDDDDEDEDDEDFLYFDHTIGKLKARQKRVVQNPYQRRENLLETLQGRSTDAKLYFDPSTGKLVTARKELHQNGVVQNPYHRRENLLEALQGRSTDAKLYFDPCTGKLVTAREDLHRY